MKNNGFERRKRPKVLYTLGLELVVYVVIAKILWNGPVYLFFAIGALMFSIFNSRILNGVDLAIILQ